MSNPLTGSCWAQVVPTYSAYWPSEPRGVKIIKITQRKPKYPEPGCMLIRVTIAVPRAAFVPLEHDVALQVHDGEFELVPALTAEPADQ